MFSEIIDYIKLLHVLYSETAFGGELYVLFNILSKCKKNIWTIDPTNRLNLNQN